MATIRATILSSFQASIEGYTGYRQLTSPVVVRGYEAYDADRVAEKSPGSDVISIRAVDEEAEELHGKQRLEASVVTSCTVPFSVDQPHITAEAVLGDLIKAVMSEIPPDASGLFYDSSRIDYPPDESAKFLLVVATFRVTYFTDIGDPFSST